MLGTVCFIACHGGPADHFATYAETLTNKGYNVEIHATGPALKKFQDRKVNVISPFFLENLSPDEEENLAQTIAKTCSAASIVITDVGHPFDVKIQEALSFIVQSVPHFAYYDNPEPLVPGGYSSTAAKVMGLAKGVLFANDTLAKAKIWSEFGKEVDFTGKMRFGIGYYPVSQAEQIAEKRKSDHDNARATFLMKNSIEDKGQRVLIYFGGNNEEYYSKAFPAFLAMIAKLDASKNIVIVIQQHPGAKLRNQDGQQVEMWLQKIGGQGSVPRIIVSDFSSDDAQVLADAAFYYQTSMGPQFVLAGIPSVQIGHETYEDVLVRNRLAQSVTTSEGLVEVIESLEQFVKMSKEDLLSCLGINEEWPLVLENAIKNICKCTETNSKVGF